MRLRLSKGATIVPLVASTALLLSACGGSNGDETSPVAQQPIAEAPADASAADAAEPSADAPKAPVANDAKAAATGAASLAAPAKGAAAEAATKATKSTATKTAEDKAAAKSAKAAAAAAADSEKSKESASEQAGNKAIYDKANGATDLGVTKDQIKLGMINMHGVALGNVLTQPVIRGQIATASQINDRGGVLGRRISLVDCDDGPGEVSRTKSCVKKLVGQDKIFALTTLFTWGSASVHDDLKQYKLPQLGSWAYSQTEWQDPYMFPTHMSMIHEAMAGAQWAKNAIKPKTYGLICLTSPEMQLACNEVAKIMDKSGSKMVKKLDLSITETSMSSAVLSMRAANPDHVIHYVINPATMVKFMIEAAQQNYYPPQGISGNHLAVEVLGALFGKHPVGRYWTNTTYKLWGPEFMAAMTKYARGNKGTNHHIVQAGYVGLNIFARAARQVGPNLTRERLIAVLGNGTVWAADASLDQRFAYTATERGDNWSDKMGQGREFMYKYTSTNTSSNPDGSPSGFAPDEKQFVIYTDR